MPLLAKAKRKAPAKQRSQEHHTSFHNSHKNPVNIHGIYSFCYNFVPEGQQALDEQPSFGGVQRQINLVFFSLSAPPVVPFGEFPEHIDMFAGFAVCVIVFI